MSDLQQLLPIIQFVEKIYEKNAAPTSKYYKICNIYGIISQLTVQVGFGSFLVLIAIAALWQSYQSIESGELVPCLLMYFPFVGEYTTGWLILVAVYNYLIVVIAAIAISPSDLTFFLIFVNIPMVSSIIGEDLKELNRVIGEVDGVSELKLLDAKQELLECLRLHRLYNG